MFEHVIRRYNKKELTNSPCKFKSKNISKENVFRKMNLVVENLDELKKKNWRFIYAWRKNRSTVRLHTQQQTHKCLTPWHDLNYQKAERTILQLKENFKLSKYSEGPIMQLVWSVWLTHDKISRIESWYICQKGNMT